MIKVLVFGEQLFTILSLVLYSGGPFTVILSGGFSEGEMTASLEQENFPQIQMLFFLNYLVTLCLLILRWKKAIYVLRKATFIWMLLLIALMSVLWSFKPEITIVRSIALVGTSLFGFYLASRYSIKEHLKLLTWTFGTVMILSLLFIVVLPKYGIMGGIHSGALRGIYVHKNVFGKIMVMSALVFWLQATNGKQQRWLPWFGLGLSVCFLLLAKSTASLINIATLFTLIPIYKTLRWRYHLMIPAVIAIVTIGGGLSLWINSNLATLLGTLGKDTTLTGRTNMWPYIWDMVEKQPWLGYGYSGFWQGWDSPAAYVWNAVQWTAPNAHNGFLDLWLELGILGLSVFVLGFCTTCIRGIAWLRLSKSSEGFWPLLYLTYMFLANIGESSLLIRNDIFWLLYVTVAISLFIWPQKYIKLSTVIPT